MFISVHLLEIRKLPVTVFLPLRAAPTPKQHVMLNSACSWHLLLMTMINLPDLYCTCRGGKTAIWLVFHFQRELHFRKVIDSVQEIGSDETAFSSWTGGVIILALSQPWNDRRHENHPCEGLCLRVHFLILNRIYFEGSMLNQRLIIFTLWSGLEVIYGHKRMAEGGIQRQQKWLTPGA